MQDSLPEHISLAEFLVWEQTQNERHEWIDGVITPYNDATYGGTSFEHSAIIENVAATIRSIIGGTGPCYLQHADRQLVPRDNNNTDLGSFYADLFVTCAQGDRAGNAAHFPAVVIEILSKHIGAEFTRKKQAYLGSRDLFDYLIIDSTQQFVTRYSWKHDALFADSSSTTIQRIERRLVSAEYHRGPVPIPTLNMQLHFDQIYAGTTVPQVLHPVLAETQTDIELH